MILGTVLPDFVKNAHKDWNFYPQKNESLFSHPQQLTSLLQGWKRHLEVDLIFHSSLFFQTETAKLKELLLPILNESPVRPSFLAHIGVELVLDHILVAHAQVNIDSFYNHLNKVDNPSLAEFLKRCGASEQEHFFKFLEGFKSSRYLLSYQKLENISYALQRICMRLWAHPFDESTLTLLTEQLEIYKLLLLNNYQEIFDEITSKLNQV